RRIDDTIDPEHGSRAATWIDENLKDKIPIDSFEIVKYIDTWHVPHDDLAPEMTPELAIFKDADALDRARILSAAGFDTRYMRNKPAKNLTLAAKLLYQVSSQKNVDDPNKLFDNVLDAAVELGIIKNDTNNKQTLEQYLDVKAQPLESAQTKKN